MSDRKYRLEYIADPKTINVSSNYPLFYVKNYDDQVLNNYLNSDDLSSLWNPNYYKLNYYSSNNNNPVYQLQPNSSNNYKYKYKLVYFPNMYGNLGLSTQYPLFQLRTSDDQIPYNLDYNDLKYLYDWNNYNLIYVPLSNSLSTYPVFQLIPKNFSNNSDKKDKNYYYNKYLKYKNKYLNLLKKNTMNYQ